MLLIEIFLLILIFVYIVNYINVQIRSEAELRRFKYLSHNSYSIETSKLTLELEHAGHFVHICKLFKTTTTLKSLTINFSVDEQGFKALSEAMLENRSIESITIRTEEFIDRESFNLFNTSIKNNKTLKLFEIRLDPEEHSLIQLMDSIKGLHMNTKIFTLSLYTLSQSFNNKQFYSKHIELLQTTNVNKIQWLDEFSLFGAISVTEETGFKEFCEFLAKHDKIKSLEMCVEIHAKILPYLASLVPTSKNLHELTMEFPYSPPSNIDQLLIAYENSHLRNLVVHGLEGDDCADTWMKLAKTFRAMDQLQSLSISTSSSVLNSYEFLKVVFESESLRQLSFNSTYLLVHKKIKTIEGQIPDVMSRNRKLQNDRVRTIITTLFNIARDTSTTQILPRDIWTIIMSFVSIPGVSIDFGSVSRSIFNDVTIRRVIKKSKI